MSCPAIRSGEQFLTATLSHIDCQAQNIGAYGYGALADPGSVVSQILIGLLTIFVALFGIRLLLGEPVGGRDVIDSVIRIGLVVTIATSWPAWRAVGYDVVIYGPVELASAIGGASGLPQVGNELNGYLQNTDDGLVAMTMYGTGRLTGGLVAGSNLGDSFRGIALADDSGLAWGRIFFLVGTIGPLAVTRVVAGLLLALAPMMAGLLLFNGSVGIFWGWVRGLAFAAISSVSLYLVEGVGVSLLGPWIADILAKRDGGAFTPSAPTELIVLALAYCLMALGTLAVVGRVTFLPHSSIARWLERSNVALKNAVKERTDLDRAAEINLLSRASVTSEAIAATMRREAAGTLVHENVIGARASGGSRQNEPQRTTNATYVTEPIGSSFRRTQRRTSAASEQRDHRG